MRDDPNPLDSYAPSRLTVNAAIALLCLIWGTTWLVIREGLRDLPPLTSASMRFSAAAVLFMLIVPLIGRRERGSSPPIWMSCIMGLFNFAVPYGVVYQAETVIPSGLASTLWAVFPIMMAISGHFLLPGERLRPAHAVGFLTGFLGVALLFATDLRGIGSSALAYGALFLLSPLSSAVANILIKKYGSGVHSMRLNRNGLCIGAAGLWIAAGLLENPGEAHWTRAAILSVAYLTVFGTVITFGLYFWLLRYAKASRLSLIAYVIPVVALLLGWAVGNETIGFTTVAGAGLILGGVWVAARR